MKALKQKCSVYNQNKEVQLLTLQALEFMRYKLFIVQKYQI